MSASVVIAAGRTGLIATDTRWSTLHGLPGTLRIHEVTAPRRAPRITHYDTGAKLAPWSKWPSSGFTTCQGDARWGYALYRAVTEANPRDFTEMEECFPAVPRSIHATVLALTGGHDGPEVAAWELSASDAPPGRGRVPPMHVDVGDLGRVVLTYVGAGDLSGEECDALGLALFAGVREEPSLRGFLRAIGRFMGDTARQSKFVSSRVDIGYWHDGRGWPLRFGADDLASLHRADAEVLVGACAAYFRASPSLGGWWRNRLAGLFTTRSVLASLRDAIGDHAGDVPL